jgi:hypothetical protein
VIRIAQFLCGVDQTNNRRVLIRASTNGDRGYDGESFRKYETSSAGRRSSCLNVKTVGGPSAGGRCSSLMKKQSGP